MWIIYLFLICVRVCACVLSTVSMSACYKRWESLLFILSFPILPQNHLSVLLSSFTLFLYKEKPTNFMMMYCWLAYQLYLKNYWKKKEKKKKKNTLWGMDFCLMCNIFLMRWLVQVSVHPVYRQCIFWPVTSEYLNSYNDD